MTPEPEPVTLESIARQILEIRAELADARSELRGVAASLRSLVQITGRVEAKAAALLAEMRAFNEAERQGD